MGTDRLILFAEDDAADALLFRIAIKKAGIPNPIAHVVDGEEAINYLRGTGIYSDRIEFPVPSVVVTDLKMPKISGFDLLAWLQSQPQFNSLPTVVLSGSAQQIDRDRALALGAQAYWVKPVAPDCLIQLLHGLKEKRLTSVNKALPIPALPLT